MLDYGASVFQFHEGKPPKRPETGKLKVVLGGDGFHEGKPPKRPETKQ